MTYSHNSVSKNLKMTSAAAAAATSTTIRSKNGGGHHQHQRKSPPASPPALSAHSNSIACSTNFFNQVLSSTTPPPLAMASAPRSSLSSSASTCSMSSSYGGSNCSGGYFGMRNQNQQYHQQQQRKSPQFFFGTSAPAGGTFFNNNKRFSYNGGSAQKPKEGRFSPQQHKNNNYNNNNDSYNTTSLTISPITATPSAASNSTVNVNARQSPPTIVGVNSARKNRNNKMQSTSALASFMTSAVPAGAGLGSTTSNSPISNVAGVGLGGKITPPTALTHFAGSKCFDAPSPMALPKPPVHWCSAEPMKKAAITMAVKPTTTATITSSAGPRLQRPVSNISCRQAMKSSKRNLLDDFETHNLKLLLNVQS